MNSPITKNNYLTLVKISPEFLSSIATDSDERIPSLYYANSKLLRYFFWLRLELICWLVQRHNKIFDTCLDFGGGGGVFLPTLSKLFTHVTLVDLEIAEAKAVAKHFKLSNVEFLQLDINDWNTNPTRPEQVRFSTIVAADVLEHFRDPTIPCTVLKSLLAPRGVLVTSLPTENYLYRTLRLIFRIEKPKDHYHTASEVERFLSINGFRKLQTLTAPLIVPLAPLFLISAWTHEKYSESNE